MRCKVADYVTDPFIEQIAAELRRPVRLDPRFDERVMAALDAPEVIPLHPGQVTRRPWYVRPFTVRVSPVAMAAAAAFVGIIGLGVWRLQPIQQVQLADAPTAAGSGDVLPVANRDAAGRVMHQFTFYQKGLKSVSLVGTLNDWDETATPMTEVSEGIWTVSVPLVPGVYQYQFILDGGRRVTDPNAPQQPSDFGSPNSLVTVTAKR